MALPARTEGREAEPALLSAFFDRIAPRIIIPATSRRLLAAFAGKDVTAEKVARVLEANPYYRYQYLKLVASMSKREDPPSLESAIVLLGMQNSRDWIVSLQLVRAVKGAHPEWGADGKLALKPADIVPFARRTDAALSGEKSGYADTAYTAAISLDWLAFVAREIVADAQHLKDAVNYLEVLHERALKCARIAVDVASGLPDFGPRRYLFAACLLHDVGKAALAILTPDYFKFLGEAEQARYPRLVRLYAEGKRFGVDHALLGWLIVRLMGTFRPIEPVILYHHEPYLLKSRNADHWKLASMVSLATTIAASLKRPASAKDPVIASWKGPELEGFKVTDEAIFTALQRSSAN